MPDAIAVINAGSSSLKFSLHDAVDPSLTPLLRAQADGLLTTPRFVARDAAGSVIEDTRWPVSHDGQHEALERIFDLLDNGRVKARLVAVGHRVVHGGPDHAAPVRVDPALVDVLERYIPLAPLHQPHNLAPIRLLLARRPGLTQVACFDTAFHRTQPVLAQAFALPREFHEQGVLRYGFHGLSYEFIAHALPAIDARAAGGRTVVLHLGNGASMCALAAGRSVATTMGFTAVDGLPMGTRCGSLDPGVLLFCLDQLRMDARAIERLLYEQSGLLGVSGISSDMRTLEASADPRAGEAIDLFVYRMGRELGSLAAALGGLDAIVFTAGIGEHSARVRDGVCRAAAWLGVEMDKERNAQGATRINTPTSRVAVLVVPTDEELMIARHTRDLLPPP